VITCASLSISSSLSRKLHDKCARGRRDGLLLTTFHSEDTRPRWATLHAARPPRSLPPPSPPESPTLRSACHACGKLRVEPIR
jgi:hypothetical protein